MLQSNSIYIYMISNPDIVWAVVAFVTGLGTAFSLLSYLSSSAEFPRCVRYPATGESTYRGKRALDGIYAILSPPGTSISQQITSRAVSNARLIKAFGLSNTFVTDSVSVHDAFVSHAKYLLNGARNWSDFLEVCVDSVDAALASFHHHHNSTISFDIFVQDATLRAVLVGFLKVNATPASLDNYHIQKVTELITVLWGLSKSARSPAELTNLEALREQLRSSLAHLGLPYHGSSGVDFETLANPLDFIIPAWETLWRVVAISFAHIYADECVMDTLAVFRDHPTMHNFTSFDSVDGVSPSIEAVVRETMRLYPPSSRIGRAIPQPSTPPSLITNLKRVIQATIPSFFAIRPSTGSSAPKPNAFRIVKADIEAIQRDPTIWGPNSTSFDPMRHHPNAITLDQKKALLPFGAGSLQCIGAKWAPMAVGVLVAAIADRVDSGLGKDYGLVKGGKMGNREGWDGWYVKRRDSLTFADNHPVPALGLAVRPGGDTNT